LRDAWFEAPGDAARQAICADIQRTVMDEVPYIPLGFYVPRMAMRQSLTGQVVGLLVFWGVHRSS
jgi:peptide/nickel transport system substrate-binding protein